MRPWRCFGRPVVRDGQAPVARALSAGWSMPGPPSTSCRPPGSTGATARSRGSMPRVTTWSDECPRPSWPRARAGVLSNPQLTSSAARPGDGEPADRVFDPDRPAADAIRQGREHKTCQPGRSRNLPRTAQCAPRPGTRPQRESPTGTASSNNIRRGPFSGSMRRVSSTDPLRCHGVRPVPPVSSTLSSDGPGEIYLIALTQDGEGGRPTHGQSASPVRLQEPPRRPPIVPTRLLCPCRGVPSSPLLYHRCNSPRLSNPFPDPWAQRGTLAAYSSARTRSRMPLGVDRSRPVPRSSILLQRDGRRPHVLCRGGMTIAKKSGFRYLTGPGPAGASAGIPQVQPTCSDRGIHSKSRRASVYSPASVRKIRSSVFPLARPLVSIPASDRTRACVGNDRPAVDRTPGNRRDNRQRIALGMRF